MKFFDDLKQIRKVMKELELAEKKAGPYIPVSSDLNENLAELVRLSEKKGSRFKVTGDTREFTITTRPDIMPLFLWAIFIFYVPVTSLFNGYIEPVEVVVMTILFITMIFWFRYASTTWDITVDTYNLQLVLTCNNPVGVFLKPDITIPFNEFKQFSSKNIFSQLKGINNLFTKVYIHHNGRKTTLIYLNREDKQEENYKVFISNLKRFISK